MNTDRRTAESTLLARIALTVAAERRSCACCGITVTGFDSDFVRLGLCGTCRGLAESSLGASGADMHLVKHCPARAKGVR